MTCHTASCNGSGFEHLSISQALVGLNTVSVLPYLPAAIIRSSEAVTITC
jgi:hypothetical protein